MKAFKTTFVSLFLLFSLNLCSQNSTHISPHDPLVQYSGRIDYSNPKEVSFSHPGTSFKMKFEGTICLILLENRFKPGEGSDTTGNYYNIIVDNNPPLVVAMTGYDHMYRIEGLEKGIHTVEVFKLTESLVGHGIFRGLEIEKGKKLLPIKQPERKIEFIGNSITCGYGNEGDSPNCHFSAKTENNYLAYGAITARNLNAAYMAVAYSGKGVIQNYSLEDKETLPVIYDRIFPDKKESRWDFKKWQPDVVVINLGTNDFAHAAPDSALFVKTYLDFLKRIRWNYPKAHIFCIEGCMIKDGWPAGIPSLTLVKKFIESAVDNFKTDTDTKIETFYLTTAKEGDFGCDYHPNKRKHQMMAGELTSFIKLKTGW